MSLDTSIYSLVKPVPSVFGQMGQAQALEQGDQNLALGKQQQQMNAQRLQMGQMEMQQQLEAKALQQKIGQAMSQSVGEDGGPDEKKLRQNFLADPALAPHWGAVQEQITKAKEATAKLQKTVQDVDATEDEKIAALDPVLAVSKYDPETAMKLLSQLGPAVSPAKAQQIAQQIQASPTPQTVQQIFSSRAAADKTQVNNKRGIADTADLAAQADERKQKLEDDKAKSALANASKQMFQAKNKDDYAQRWAGLPVTVRAQFDAPTDYVDGESQKRALELGQTPDQIVQRAETAKRDAANEENQKAQRKQAEATRQATDAYRKARLATAGNPKKDAELDLSFKVWNANLARTKTIFDAKMEAWNARHFEEKISGEDDPKDPRPKYVEPPEFEPFRLQFEESRGKPDVRAKAAQVLKGSGYATDQATIDAFLKKNPGFK